MILLFACSPLLGTAQELHQAKHPHHHPRTVEEWIKTLENPERDGWQKPAEVVQALEIEPGQRVADLGAGTGYFAVRFAQAVGPEGKVYAVDIDPGLVEYLGQRAKKENITNFEPVLGAADDPRLELQSVDLIFVCDVIHHVENRAAYYPKLARALRPGGRLAIVDFYKRELPVGPGMEMKIAKQDMIAELTQAGFTLQQDLDFLPYQYFLVFEPAAQ